VSLFIFILVKFYISIYNKTRRERIGSGGPCGLQIRGRQLMVIAAVGSIPTPPAINFSIHLIFYLNFRYYLYPLKKLSKEITLLIEK
jgi:hypothetical protein